jgi:hypothetical protein
MLKKTMVLAGAIAMLSLAAPAHADDVTHGNNGVVTGNPVHAPITVPVIACGIAGGIGLQFASCEGNSNTQVQSR